MPPETRATVDLICEVLAEFRLRFGTEEQLQADVAAALTASGIEFLREIPLTTGGRIDFYLPGDTPGEIGKRIGLECKVAGGPSAVLAQLIEYADCGGIDGLILVSRKRGHCLRERDLRGKPFRSLWIGASSL